MHSFIFIAAFAGLTAAAATGDSDAYPLKHDGQCVIKVGNSALALDDCSSDAVVKFVADDGYLRAGSEHCLGQVEQDGKRVPGLVTCDGHKGAHWTELKGKWIYNNGCKYIRVKDGKLVFTRKSEKASDFDFEGDIPSDMSADETPAFCGCGKCPSDSVCKENTCVRRCQCGSDNDCGYGQKCHNDWCKYHRGCTSSKQCASGYTCDTATGRCVADEITCDWPYELNGNYCHLPKPECSCNKPCPSGKVCYYGQCGVC